MIRKIQTRIEALENLVKSRLDHQRSGDAFIDSFMAGTFGDDFSEDDYQFYVNFLDHETNDHEKCSFFRAILDQEIHAGAIDETVEFWEGILEGFGEPWNGLQPDDLGITKDLLRRLAESWGER